MNSQSTLDPGHLLTIKPSLPERERAHRPGQPSLPLSLFAHSENQKTRCTASPAEAQEGCLEWAMIMDGETEARSCPWHTSGDGPGAPCCLSAGPGRRRLDSPTWHRCPSRGAGGGSGGRGARAPSAWPGGGRGERGAAGSAQGGEEARTGLRPQENKQVFSGARSLAPRPSPRPAPFLCPLLG